MPDDTRDPTVSPEIALVRRVVAGDRQALATLYEKYATSVYGSALRILKSSADAEDVVQEVFLSLRKNLRTFEGRGALEGWIRRVASRVALMSLRRRNQRREVRIDGGLLDYFTTATVDTASKVALEIAIQKLPEKLRMVYILKEVEGFSHGEIANLLDITARASRVRLHRARKLLRELL